MDIQIFTIDKLQINILKHVLQPDEIILYNNEDKAFKPKKNFTIKYADQSHDLEWLVNEFI